MLINDDGLTPTHGELVICDMCGKTYKFFIWAFGSDKHLCRKCVNKRPQSYLDNIDAIDIGEEHDMIHEETEEQDRRDFPREKRRTALRKNIPMSQNAYRKISKRYDETTIKRFRRKNERSAAIDVTGLG